MLFTNLIKDYFVWHYSTAFREGLHIWKNFLWFVLHLFSISQLMKTWFAPWKRIREERNRAWDFKDFASSLFIDLLSRLIGFLIRTVFILVGSLFLLFTLIFGLGVMISWFVLPVLPITLIFLGIAILIV
jgi:hypothetical protein